MVIIVVVIIVFVVVVGVAAAVYLQTRQAVLVQPEIIVLRIIKALELTWWLPPLPQRVCLFHLDPADTILIEFDGEFQRIGGGTTSTTTTTTTQQFGPQEPIGLILSDGSGVDAELEGVRHRSKTKDGLEGEMITTVMLYYYYHYSLKDGGGGGGGDGHVTHPYLPSVAQWVNQQTRGTSCRNLYHYTCGIWTCGNDQPQWKAR